MQAEAQNIVALNSKEQGQVYYRNGNFGRAFAHFLVALKLKPEWKKELKLNFSSTLCAWGNQLESQQRYKDLFNCYEQAIAIFPENEDVFSNLGAHLFRSGHLREAAHYFRQALEVNSNYLPAFHNLQSVCNLLVERWHFRMLNDSHRNEAYREAIFKKVRQGFDKVLDIGTGTGILSLYAVRSGAKDVYACDYSATMCAIAREVLQANKMDSKIKLLHKLSNDLTIPGDLPCKMSLVVTETMDSGLLGEHLLQTLLHAWEHLLQPSCPQLLAALTNDTPPVDHGVVLPLSATLWAAPVRCTSIARKNYLVHQEEYSKCFSSVWLYSNSSEPYDTENLRNLKDCKFLQDPVEVFCFDFNNPTQLKTFYEGQFDSKPISFFNEEKADALAIWFDVKLDEDITISSSPLTENKHCCWDQAIFSLKKPQDSVKARASCAGGKLKFDFATEPFTSGNEVTDFAVGTDCVSFINNIELQNILFSLPEHLNNIKSLLDLSAFPLMGLSFLKLKETKLCCVLKMQEEVDAVVQLVKDNDLNLTNVKCLIQDDFDNFLLNTSEKYDFILNNLFETTGELSENSVINIPKLLRLLTPDGVLSPVQLQVVCQLVDCDWLRQTSAVHNEELTEVYQIAEIINVYKVSQQLDVDLRNTPYTSLSEVMSCLQLKSLNLAADSCQMEELILPVVGDGCTTGIAVWYQYQLCEEGPFLSTFTENSHVNQIMFVVDPPLPVKIGDSVKVHITYLMGRLRLKILS